MRASPARASGAGEKRQVRGHLAGSEGAPSGAPIAGESALTSGYLLVEARSPLPSAPRVSSRPS
jgi:hypothetical protein